MKLVIAGLLFAGTGGQGHEKGKSETEKTLHAEGNGLVYIRGHGSLTITGEGSLWYKDLAGDAQIPEKVADGDEAWKFVPGIGTFSISGSDFIVMALGKDLVIDATGKGKAQMVGKGLFEVHNRSGTWADEPKPTPYGPKPLKTRAGGP
ncbi:MAG: hypothetical protein ABIM59_05130 [candidate division WOR-3 bacterium]